MTNVGTVKWKMRLLLVLLLAIALAIYGLDSEHAYDAYLKGNELYRQGKIISAIAKYREAIKADDSHIFGNF